MSRLALFAAALAAVACDPRRFDDLADTTWIEKVGKPDELASLDYGISVGAIPRADGVALVVGARSPAGLGLAEISGTGDVTSNGGIPAALPLTNSAEPVAIVAAGSDVFVGAPAQAEGLLRYNTMLTGGVAITLPVAAAGVGGRVAVGVLNSTTEDVVATASGGLVIAPDHGNGTAIFCNGLAGTPSGLAVADHDGDGDNEIWVTVGGSPAQLLGFDPSLITDGAPCANGAIGTFDFGNGIIVLAAGQLDTDPGIELLAGQPDIQRVWLHDDTGTITELTAPTLPTGVDEPVVTRGTWGFAVALVDLDGDGAGELVVGDHQAEIDGVMGAGSVDILDSTGALKQFLFHTEPDTQEKFGRSVTVVPFTGPGGTASVLVVGSEDTLFTYFRTLTAATDPRQQ